MAIRLVAIVLVLAVCRGLPDLVRLRDFSWFHAWLAKIDRQSAATVLVLGIGVPALLTAIVEAGLDRVLLGLFGLVLSAAVLYYCWGPRDLERDVEAVVKAPDAERRAVALHALRDSDDVTFTSETLVESVFAAALSRWFGVLFWFVVLGPAGALFYRADAAARAVAGLRARTIRIDADRRATSRFRARLGARAPDGHVPRARLEFRCGIQDLARLSPRARQRRLRARSRISSPPSRAPASMPMSPPKITKAPKRTARPSSSKTRWCSCAACSSCG